MLKDFYVYEWFNKENNYVFYVGKGRGYRYLVKDRNDKFNEYLNNHACDVRIVYSNLTEKDSFLKEAELIEKYKLIGQCECNLIAGGAGGLASTWDDEMRQAMSEHNPMKNKEIAKKVSNSKRKTPVINGRQYNTVEEASKECGVCVTTIWRWCKRGYDTNGNECHYLNENPTGEFKVTNSKRVYVDSIIFSSVKEASEYIGCWSENLIKAIKNNKPCKGHIVSYVNQQPS